ncbi:MAG: GNAT family N-acetyltransferase, partial [Micrococcales bacterium]|nr:GNAT family N-acetyltransferase [Micrococcales bacterium]
MTCSIRLAEPGDLDRIGAITAASYLDGGHLPAGDDYVATLRDAPTRAEQAELWVAVRDGELVGSVTFVPPGSPLEEVSDPAEAEVRMLAVSAVAQGQGVGELLVRHCLRRAGELGLEGIALSTLPSMTSAHRLYERLGFVRTPARDWSPV